MTPTARLVWALALICWSAVLACTDSEDLSVTAAAVFVLVALGSVLLPATSEHRQ